MGEERESGESSKQIAKKKSEKLNCLSQAFKKLDVH